MTAMMRILTVVYDVVAGTRRSIYLEVSPTAAFQTCVPALMHVTGADLTGATAAIAVDGKIVDTSCTVAELGIHEGSWTSLLADVRQSPITPRLLPADGSMEMRVVSGEGAGTIYSLSPGFLTVGTQLDVMIPLPSSTAKKGSATGFYAEIPTEIAPKTNAAKEEQPTIRIHPLLHIRGAAHHGASSPLAGSVYDAVGKQPRGLKRIIANSQRRKQRKHGLLFSDIFIDGKELLETREVHLGEQIVLPTCTVEFARFDAAAIPVDKNTEYGHWLFARPPKISRELPSHALKIPHEPARPEKMPIPLAMSLLPLAASIAMAYFMKNWTFLAFGIMSPIMMLSSAFSNNRQTRKRWKKQKRHWREVMERTKNKAQGLIEQESQQLRTDFPSPAAIAEIAETHNARLWERRINDSAWLCLRIGMGTVRSHITLEDMNEPEDERVKRWEMKDVPATVSLAQVGCLGIAGDASDVRRLASWFMLQMATLHSMHDLSLSLLSPVGDNGIEERANRWSFCQWLPHFRNTESRKSLRNIAISQQKRLLRKLPASQLYWMRGAPRCREESMRNGAAALLSLFWTMHTCFVPSLG